MPLYRGTITKQLIASGERWSNVYTLNCVDAFAAESAIVAIAGIEKAVTFDTVRFIRAHVVNKANKFDQRSPDVVGPGFLHHEAVGEMLPLFCTFRVIFVDAASKPEQKYLRRPGWTDEVTAFGTWGADFTEEINTLYVAPLLAMAEYVGPSGEAHVSGFCSPLIQNRQQGWHRRTRPGFRRGWVPA